MKEYKKISDIFDPIYSTIKIPSQYLDIVFTNFAYYENKWSEYSNGTYKLPKDINFSKEQIDTLIRENVMICNVIFNVIYQLKLVPIFEIWCKKNGVDCWTMRGLNVPSTFVAEKSE